MKSAYFAYGSNMSPERLQARVPRIEPLGRACLIDWRLSFDKPSRDGSAKANIRRQAKEVVWGVLWQIEVQDWATLDRFEPGYERVDCPVAPDLDQPTRTAFTYVYPGPVCDEPPFEWYLDHLLEGARVHDLPSNWQSKLESIRAGCITPAEAESSRPPPKRRPAARR